jgi:membrane-bound lytic murein transglycosylase D
MRGIRRLVFWCAALALPAPCLAAAEVSALLPPAPPVLPDADAALEILSVPTDLPPLATIDLTREPVDLWDRIRRGFSMPDLDSELVARQQAYYLNHPQYLTRITERSRRYLHHIVEEIEKRGLPMELALLPMVESAFNPMAYSRARASGIWQFIPSTGRNFRLRQDWWVDQRRDIVASTSAALDYLQAVYDMHGDWHLALASYNWGEGAVGRAIDKNRNGNQPTDYASLSMPSETRNYVPKLQALKNIVTNPAVFGVSLAPIPNRPYFATVDKPGDMDVALAARLAEVPVQEFVALNPGFNRPVVTGQAQLVLPADKVETFLENLDNHDKPLVSWSHYTMRKGDRLDRVAARYGISTARLRQINGLSGRGRIGPGRTLLVPTGGTLVSADGLSGVPMEEPEVEDSPPVKKVWKRGKNGKRVLVVVRDERGKQAAKGTARAAKASARPAGRSAKTVKTVSRTPQATGAKAVKTSAKATAKKPAAKPGR